MLPMLPLKTVTTHVPCGIYVTFPSVTMYLTSYTVMFFFPVSDVRLGYLLASFLSGIWSTGDVLAHW